MLLAEAGGPARSRSGPVIVLTYAHAGADDLQRTLQASRSLACTAGTGVLPLCDSVATTWQKLENRGTAPSPLAVRSIRALVDTMTAVLRAGTGASRWCETAFATPAAAQTFLRAFPDATFLCLYRGLPGVLAEAAAAYPWGLGGSPFWAHSGGHPGNNAATIAAWWTACVGPLLDFEAGHQSSCLRVRYEDLAADPGRLAGEVFARLGLDSRDLAAPGLHDSPGPDSGPDPAPPLPAERIPPKLLADVRELHARLDYVL